MSEFASASNENEAGNVVQIYILELALLEGEDDRILPAIAPFYVQKYERGKVPSVKKQELGAGYLLAKYLDIHEDDQLKIGEFGKPYINTQNTIYSSEAAKTAIKEFSLSHSNEYVVLATSAKPIGIDIERADRITLPVLERVLPPVHFQHIKNGQYEVEPELSGDEKLVWAKCWTSVEAVLKATGDGFRTDPRENPALLDGWHIKSFPFQGSSVISVAARETFSISVNIDKGPAF